MSDRQTSVTVRVTGKPAVDSLEFEGWAPRGSVPKRYRVGHVALDATFRSGSWSRIDWSAHGSIIKKDGTVGQATKEKRWDFQPDAETRRQFLALADKELRAVTSLAAVDEANGGDR